VGGGDGPELALDPVGHGCESLAVACGGMSWRSSAIPFSTLLPGWLACFWWQTESVSRLGAVVPHHCATRQRPDLHV
jgi:hypothetical protein